jgi:hypothetical protein
VHGYKTQLRSPNKEMGNGTSRIREKSTLPEGVQTQRSTSGYRKKSSNVKKSRGNDMGSYMSSSISGFNNVRSRDNSQNQNLHKRKQAIDMTKPTKKKKTPLRTKMYDTP